MNDKIANPPTSIYKNILEGIGNTPLVRLGKITKEVKSEIFTKLEYFNPMGSVKDRIASYMIDKAEKEGRIKPGDTIIDNSSGNTALGLAMVCSVKGYNVKMVVRNNLSMEKIKFLRAMNVELVMVDHTMSPNSPNSYNNITPRIVKETPGGYYFDQHNNRENSETHYHSTGPEIWEQMEGKIDFFVAGLGTGGTICGVAKFLREKNPNIKVIGVDPVGSIFYDYFHTKKIIPPSPYYLEGLGDEFLIGCVDFSLIDDIYQITDKKAFQMVRELADKEAILAGGSSGAALWGCIELAKKIDKPARIVTVFADSGTRYLSSIYNDDWLKEKGFLD
ncbi:MAG: cysteine synthase family protein [Candidatus Aminicenantes bacterium]|nr:MAG: cysteine synthase family protein [Candidatus Aminicenantes bacterium]